MKKFSYIYMLLFSAALFVGCSNEDKEAIEPNIEPKNDVITITANAPVVQDDKGSTRIAFEDDNGLEMRWETTDLIRLRAYNIKGDKWSYGTTSQRPGADRNNTSITGPTAGTPSSTATFTFAAFINDPVAYTITIGNNGGLEAQNWASAALTAEQTQDCTSGNETSHLNANYTAILQYIRAASISSSSITFSADWASANAYVPQETPAENEPGSSDCGVFMQSSCLKMPLTLPTLPNGEYNNITKMVITTSRETSDGSTARSFYNNNKGSAVINTITLNFSNVPNSSSLTAYFMLASAGLRVYNNAGDATKWNIKIYYKKNDSEDQDFIYKDITFTTATDGNTTERKQGRLYKVTVGNVGWKDSSDNAI